MYPPVVLVPGIKGTALVNAYPLRRDVIWSETNMFYEDFTQLFLDKSGLYDKSQDILNLPAGPLPPIYCEMVETLEEMLGAGVFLFGYDWRMDIRLAAKKLFGYLKYIKGKTGADTFNLVTHSLGGLVLMAALKKHPDMLDMLERTVMICTPCKGVLDAVITLVHGESGILLNSSRKTRKLARTLPSVYQMLPSYDRAMVDIMSDGAMEVFDMDSWQGNVIHRGGETDGKLSPAHLADAKEFTRSDLLDFSSLDGNTRRKFLIIYGKGKDTARTLLVKKGTSDEGSNKNWFCIKDDDHPIQTGDGDGVVLAEESALLQGVASVSIDYKHHEDDAGLFHPLKYLAKKGIGFHAALPSVDEVQKFTANFFMNRPVPSAAAPRNADTPLDRGNGSK